jgi:hypothetical protein
VLNVGAKPVDNKKLLEAAISNKTGLADAVVTAPVQRLRGVQHIVPSAMRQRWSMQL